MTGDVWHPYPESKPPETMLDKTYLVCIIGWQRGKPVLIVQPDKWGRRDGSVPECEWLEWPWPEKVRFWTRMPEPPEPNPPEYWPYQF